MAPKLRKKQTNYLLSGCYRKSMARTQCVKVWNFSW